MMQDNKIKNYITSWKGVGLYSLFFLLLSLPVYAQKTIKDRLTETGGVDGAGYEDISGSEDTYFAEKLGNFIEILLSFLGVVFLVLIIYGGFMWMTAQGNEEQVGKAKKIIVNSVVGTVIVMLAYAITYFVLLTAGESAGFNLN